MEKTNTPSVNTLTPESAARVAANFAAELVEGGKLTEAQAAQFIAAASAYPVIFNVLVAADLRTPEGNTFTLFPSKDGAALVTIFNLKSRRK